MSVATLAMVLITFAVVVLRYGFNVGWIALQESVMYLHSAVFMLAAAYTLRSDGHVRVDVFYRRLSPVSQAKVNLLGTLVLMLPTCSVIFLYSLPYVTASWRLMESSIEAGGLPLVFVLKTLLPVTAAMLMLQGLADIVRYTLMIKRAH
ncbi:hypothetical protein GCM10007391_28030 [Alteromonas halophila]|uniref:TRAP transporter small permease protein n=1 Tax=Alteromonas halophila TaxID=516698 RepID=A0A918JPS8_9ALTE|nr:hypothetical protein GCM10007391_28030 [Alteromonas halophila]